MHLQREEYEQKLRALEDSRREQAEALDASGMDEFHRQVERENQQKELEFERERKRLLEMEKIIRRRKVVLQKLEKKLSKVSMSIGELNLIGKELQKKVQFFLDVGPGYLEDDSVLYSMSDLIRVKVVNEEYFNVYYWDLSKLNDRYFLIRERLEKYFETEVLESLEKDKDPFWDPEEAIDLGRAYISLRPISFLFDLEKTLKIYHETDTIGEVCIRLFPSNQYGQPLPEEDVQEVTEPMQLLGEPLSFTVQIKQAKILPYYTKLCFLQYKLAHDDFAGKEFRTSKVQSESGIIDFEYQETHTIDSVDQSGVVFLTETKVGSCDSLVGTSILLQSRS